MRRWFPLAVLVGLVLLAARSLWWPPAPFFFLDDGYLHLFRVFEFDRVLGQGVLYPRWAPDLAYGYGYPIFNYYPPLAYYLTETLHLIGLALPDAVKGAFVVTLAAGLGGAYLLGRSLCAESTRAVSAGVVTAAAYVFFPYFLLDIYTRGAMAEALAAALLPWLVWSLRRALHRPGVSTVALVALFAALLVLAHNLTAFFSAPLLAAYVLFELARLPAAQRFRSVAGLATALFVGAAAAAIYWLPLVTQVSLVAVSRESKQLATIVQYSFLGLQDVIQLSPAYRYHEAPFPLAVVPMTLAALGVLLALVRRRLAGRGPVLFFGIMALGGTVLLTDWTKGLWLGVPVLQTLQFPWRLSVLIGLGAAVAIGALPILVTQEWRERPRLPVRALVAAALVAVVVWVGLANLAPQRLDNPTRPLTLGQLVRFEANSRNIGLGTMDEYLPLTVKYLPKKLDPRTDARPMAAITLQEYTATRRALTVSSPERLALALHAFYFPDWQVTIDGQPALPAPSTAMGLLTVDVPAGEHRVVFAMGDAVPRSTGAGLTGIGLVVLLALAAVGAAHRDSLAPAVLITLGCAVAIFGVPSAFALASAPPGLQPVQVDVSSELRLIGVRIDGARRQADRWQVSGTPDHLELEGFWQVKQSVPEEPFVWQLVDAGGRVCARREQLARFGSGLAATWVRDEIVPDQYDLALAPGMPAGRYALQAGFGSSPAVTVTIVELEQGSAAAKPAPAIAHSQAALAGDRIRFLGYDAPASARAGTRADLVLYWQAERDVQEDLTVFVQLLDANGNLVAQNDGLTADGFNPTTLWPAGQVVTDARSVLVPPSLKPGAYRWVAGLYHSDTLARLPVITPDGQSPDDLIVLGMLKVPMEAENASPDLVANVSLGARLALRGYDLVSQDGAGKTIARAGTPIAPAGQTLSLGDGANLPRLAMRSGQVLSLKLYWRALAAMDTDYKVFIHVVDEQGSVVAQQDRMPGQDRYPTRIWEAGEKVTDPYLLPLELAPGRYRVVIGVYAPESGERLAAVAAEGGELADRQIVLGEIEVTGP